MRDQWNNKLGFHVLPAIGLEASRTSATCGDSRVSLRRNGGGASLVPYFFCYHITAGIPILILEYTMGKTYRGGAPVTWARINQ